jgi:hypothetical protein
MLIAAVTIDLKFAALEEDKRDSKYKQRANG